MKVLFLIIIFILFAPLTLLAQDNEIPDFLSSIFDEAFLVAVGTIIGFTKMIRNMVNVKGPIALAITGVVSLGYGFIQYNSQGIVFAIGVGLVAFASSAGLFALLKQGGKKLNPSGTK